MGSSVAVGRLAVQEGLHLSVHPLPICCVLVDKRAIIPKTKLSSTNLPKASSFLQCAILRPQCAFVPCPAVLMGFEDL